MSSDEQSERLDQLLELLSKPLTRYILSVIAGVDPGIYIDTTEDNQVQTQDENNDSVAESSV